MNKRQRTRNQRYQAKELNTPIQIFRKEQTDDGGYSGVEYQLYQVAKCLALAYKPSAKDIDILSNRFSETSLTLILTQNNSLIIDTSMVIKINDQRLGVGYFDIDQVIPDIQGGRYLKLLIQRNQQSNGTFEVVEDGE